MNKSSTWAWICSFFTVLAITSGVITGVYMDAGGSIRENVHRDLLVALFALLTSSSVSAILSFIAWVYWANTGH